MSAFSLTPIATCCIMKPTAAWSCTLLSLSSQSILIPCSQWIVQSAGIQIMWCCHISRMTWERNKALFKLFMSLIWWCHFLILCLFSALLKLSILTFALKLIYTFRWVIMIENVHILFWVFSQSKVEIAHFINWRWAILQNDICYPFILHCCSVPKPYP